MRLVRVNRSDLTLVRAKSGKGFSYRDGAGVLIADAATRARIKALGIPPAWKTVRIAASEKAHIQVLGVDEAGREQYIYHPDWELRRDGKKQKRLAALTAVLPRVRKKIAEGLGAETGSRELAMAIAVALIDKTAMRVGREKYLDANGTRGAGTLYARDVRVAGDEVCMAFDAKGGKRAEYCLTDARLADAVGRIKTLSGKRLLVYRDEAGKVRPINTSAINDYLRELAGVDISAKDFRTLHASSLAGEVLAQLVPGTSETARRRQMAQVAKQVSEVLRNTPAICRKSYIAPCLFKLFDKGKLKPLWDGAGNGRAGLLAREKRLGVVLAAMA
ncbi:DNA topoisomerase-1 [Devosia sp. YR412]|uniref:DNA topoisomerase IB n=1 Tax=Devosia sp. YR412 TaxID=1881030 RepID=UPI0008B23E80|nr:DNA topoisomerase IB [Devosia sp. YR412]SEQ06603.1 DNA topoisomerase-1 [Devosia sp. YR412]